MRGETEHTMRITGLFLGLLAGISLLALSGCRCCGSNSSSCALPCARAPLPPPPPPYLPAQ